MPLPTIEADALHMRQIFQNLLSNALKYHKPGVPPVIDITTKTQKNRVSLSISDNGIGFDDKQADKLFQPFERLHTHLDYEGTGMGMAICQRVVHAYKGTITATSQVQKGSTFLIQFPLKMVKEDVKTSKAHILLVENSPKDQEKTIKTLTENGYTYEVSQNGRDALNAYLKNNFDLILMDWELPVMDGLEASRAIRKMSHTHTPIIALTGVIVSEVRKNCLSAGMDDILKKSVPEKTLIKTIEKWLKK